MTNKTLGAQVLHRERGKESMNVEYPVVRNADLCLLLNEDGGASLITDGCIGSIRHDSIHL